MALIDQPDAEQVLAILFSVQRAVTDAIPQHHGFASHTRGDGIMVLFGAPIANDDQGVEVCSAVPSAHRLHLLDIDLLRVLLARVRNYMLSIKRFGALPTVSSILIFDGLVAWSISGRST